MSREWEKLYAQYKSGVLKKRRSELTSVLTATIVFAALAGTSFYLDWPSVASIFAVFAGLAAWAAVVASKGTLFGAWLDIIIIGILTAIAVSHRTTIPPVVLAIGGLYALYLCGQVVKYVSFRRSNIAVANFPDARLPLLPEVAAIGYFAEHGQPAAALMPADKLTTLTSEKIYKKLKFRCSKCGSPWPKHVQSCVECKARTVLVLNYQEAAKPNNEAAPLENAVAKLESGDLKAALRALESIAGENSAGAEPYAWLAWTLLAVGKPRDAADAADEAIRRDPHLGPAYALRSVGRYLSGDVQGSTRDFYAGHQGEERDDRLGQLCTALELLFHQSPPTRDELEDENPVPPVSTPIARAALLVFERKFDEAREAFGAASAFDSGLAKKGLALLEKIRAA